MANVHQCVGCNNSFATSQSLWNHKQRCSQIKPVYEKRQDPFPSLNQPNDKTNFIQNIINKGTSYKKKRDSANDPFDRSRILEDIFNIPRMDVEPITKNMSSLPKKTPPSIPIEAINNLAPKPLTEIVKLKEDVTAGPYNSDPESESGSKMDQIRRRTNHLMLNLCQIIRKI